MSVIKILGLIFVFGSCAVFGFYKAHSLCKRKNHLGKIIDSMYSLYENISYNGGELSAILPISLSSCDFIIYRGRKTEVLSDFLQSEDKRIVKEFFDMLGSADSDTECKRIKRSIALLERQYSTACSECNQKMRLWQCAGVSVGLAFCILLI